MRSAHRVVLALALCVTLLLSGCAGAPMPLSEAQDSASSAPGAAPAPMAPQEPSSGEYYGLTNGSSAPLPSYQEAQMERMIIRTANLTVIVQDAAETLDTLTELARGYNGYVADSNRWYSNEQLYANVTLRVPAESLDAFLADVQDLAIRVDSESVSGDDVTEEYADIAARLTNLEATEVELRQLLTEVRENRGKADEILAVHRELTNIRGQIEQLKGRQQYLERMTALSTVEIQVRPEAAPRAVVRESWNPLVTVSDAAHTLLEAGKGFLSVAIYAVVLSPLLLIPAGGLWLLAYVVRRRKQSREVTA